MVRSAKRITRKDIRQPDLFVTFTGRLLHVLQQHRTAFALSVVLIFTLLVGVWGWQSYKRSQQRLAGEKYAVALSLYRNGQYRDAIDALETVRSFRGTTYGALALLYQGNSHLALKEYGKAESALQEFLKQRSENSFLRQLGLVTLGHTLERTGQCKEAVGMFAQAQNTAGPLQEDALLAKARCQTEIGLFKDAVITYRDYLSTYPNSEKKGELALRIQELEVKVGGANQEK